MCNLKQFTIVHGFMDAVWISCGDIGCGHEVRVCKGFLGNVAQYLDHNSQCTQPMYIAKGCRSSDK